MHYLLAIAAGAVLPLAFAPFDQFWLAPLSYAVLLYCWRDAAPRRAFGLGFAYGCASFGARHVLDLHRRAHHRRGARVRRRRALTVGLTVVLAAFVALAGFVAARCVPHERRRRVARDAAGAVRALRVAARLAVHGLRLALGRLQPDRLVAHGLRAASGGIHAMSWAVLVTAGALLTLWLGTTPRARRRRRRGRRGRLARRARAARSQSSRKPKERRALRSRSRKARSRRSTKYEPEQLPADARALRRAHAARAPAPT